MNDNSAFIRIARITGAHGLRGRLDVFIISDRADRFEPGKQVYVGEEGALRPFRIAEFSVRKGRKGYLGLEGIADRDSALVHKGRDVFIPVDEAEKTRGSLEEGAFYYYDILGCEVFWKGNRIGEVVDIIEAGGGQILIIRNDAGRERMIPFVSFMVNTDDVAERRITINPVEGLIEEDNAP